MRSGADSLRTTLLAHARYGPTFEHAAHPRWSAQNPVHLVGHSLGALTAIEFYQLVSADFFGVGSDHRWVRSITSIAGPLTGSTLTHLVGLHDEEMRRGSLAHMLYIVLTVWAKLYTTVPLLRDAYDLRMDQWADHSMRDLCSVDGPVNRSLESGLFSILPSRRVQLNSQLQHMDKLHLLSIVTSPKTFHVPVGEVSTLAGVLLLAWGKFPRWWPLLARTRRFRGVLGLLLVASLWRQVKKLDLAKLPSLYGLKWLMRRTAKALPQIFDGFDAHHWEHNDGAVNIRSQLRPWFPKPQVLPTATAVDHMDPHTRTFPASLSSAALSDLEASASHVSVGTSTTAATLPHNDSHISIVDFHHDGHGQDSEKLSGQDQQRVNAGGDDEHHQQHQQQQRFRKGQWYVYRVNSNHLTGTYWDRDAGNLYRSLFVQIANEYEHEDDDVEEELDVRSGPLRRVGSATAA